tara:strand:+ start:592 stop:801 length:210 start_codon:yes stop_codon:yes gene_type:complete
MKRKLSWNQITQERYDEWLKEKENSLERFKFKSSIKKKRVQPFEGDIDITVLSPKNLNFEQNNKKDSGV